MFTTAAISEGAFNNLIHNSNASSQFYKIRYYPPKNELTEFQCDYISWSDDKKHLICQWEDSYEAVKIPLKDVYEIEVVTRLTYFEHYRPSTMESFIK